MSLDIGDKAPDFTIPTDGKRVICGLWREVKVPGHVDEVLKAMKAP
ncbi:MAG TPA: hypothetical protein VKB68_06015 [Stellaceae bacterium]|nr:hypothetical protein [Stellaceae bacterium]